MSRNFEQQLKLNVGFRKDSFNKGIKKIRDRLYGEKGLQNSVEQSNRIEIRKALALMDQKIDQGVYDRSKDNDHINNIVKEYLNLFDEVIPNPVVPPNLYSDIQNTIEEYQQSIKLQSAKQEKEESKRRQFAFLVDIVKSPKSWAFAFWIVSLYFILKHFFS